jgi:hypothetical protein
MDEGPAAHVDERAVVGDLLDHAEMCWKGIISFAQVLIVNAGIIVHRCTSVYINRNEVELRLGTNIEVHSSYILLTYSKNTLCSTCSHPDASCGRKEPSQ